MTEQQLDQIKSEFKSQYLKNIVDPEQPLNEQEFTKILKNWEEIHKRLLEAASEALHETLAKCAPPAEDEPVNNITLIEADDVVLQVQDKKTGKLFNRALGIHYHENNNGLLLTGETLEGRTTSIAFYSQAAINKINDLIGKGPDSGLHDHNN